jgi:hypothetical protein
MLYLDSSPAKVSSPTAYPDTPEGNQRRWCAEIQAAEKEQRDWWTQGDKVVRRYEDRRDAVDAIDRKFNLFPTNVQIMESALYEHAPVPEVRRKFDDPNDDVGRVAAEIIERAISQDLEDPSNSFGQTMKACIKDWLVPGLGTCWLRLHVETTTQNDPSLQSDYEIISEEEVVIEHTHWKDLLWSPCRTWEDRRWVGRRVYMMKPQVLARFGADKEKKVSYKQPSTATADPNDPSYELFAKAEIYEIWDREKKHVWWINKGMSEVLDDRDDPLKLSMFEPMPKPLFALQTTSNVIPRPDYVMCQDQYQELDIVNNRISLLIQACKAVGVYDRANQGVQRLMTEGFDNSLIPVDNWAMFAERGGLKGVIDWLPLEVVVQAVQTLNVARETIKQQIYEVTGIADIVRGATKASETLGAQQMKAKFASIRIQSRQEDVARFASEILRIKAEMMLKHMQFDTVLERSGIQYLGEDPNLVGQAVQLIKDHKQFEWRVNIQSDSMAQIDYADEKADRMELMNVLGSFMQGALPAMQQQPDMIPIASALIKYVISSFRAGKEIEGVLDMTMDNILKQYQQQKANPQPKPDPAMMKAQSDAQATQMKTQAAVQSIQAKTQAQIQTSNAKAAADMKGKQLQLVHSARMSQQKHEADMHDQATQQLLKAQQQHFEQRQARDAQIHQQLLAAQGQSVDQNLAVQGQAHSQALAEQGQSHDQNLQEQGQEHNQSLENKNAAHSRRLAAQEAGADTGGGGSAADEADVASASDKKLDAMMAAITQMAEAVATMSKSLSAPKRVVRDSSGRAVGMEVVK